MNDETFDDQHLETKRLLSERGNDAFRTARRGSIARRVQRREALQLPGVEASRTGMKAFLVSISFQRDRQDSERGHGAQTAYSTAPCPRSLRLLS